MEGAAGGSDGTALVVVDPHQDLAEAVLDAVPPELEDRTTYLDFANLERPVGLNLLDVALFPDRDRTTEHIVTMMNRLWPANWGPRMEGALRASLLALLDANRHYEREAQFTLLDVAPMLTDRELRERVLDQVQDPAVRAWWRDNYDRAGSRAAAADREPRHLEDRPFHGHRGIAPGLRAGSLHLRSARDRCVTAACSSSTPPSARSARAPPRSSGRRCSTCSAS